MDLQDLRDLKPDRKSGHRPGPPLYQQLYRRFKEAIAEGKLRPGDRVPSVRSLASELGIARGTVELAYQVLAGEGYFLARGPAGTVVSPRLDGVGGAQRATVAKPRTSQRQTVKKTAEAPQPFAIGLPALDAFPRKTWTRLAVRGMRTLDMDAMAFPDPAGYWPLRAAVAAYLGISRGIACSADQVFITAGYRGALELVCRSLLQSGDCGWHEDPGYTYVRDFLQRLGMVLSPVPVDAEGLDVEAGRRKAPGARFAVVTPTHQYPTGAALSLPRRLALLKWAKREQAWIIEDDYDSEFRYRGRPLPALKSLDQDGRVLYSSSFSKVLFPGLRLGYVVVPESRIDRFQESASHLPGPGSILPQATVADFMEQGHFARHLRKMRALYAQRRGYLIDALEKVFGDSLPVAEQAGGTHVVALLPAGCDERAVAALAQARGLAVQALSHWRMRRAQQGGLLMGFTNIATPGQALVLVRQLAKAIQLPRA